MTGVLKGKYNSGILCVSSLIYLLAGVVMFRKSPYLSLLLFIVTAFSILYHRNFKNFNLKAPDWMFGAILAVYLYYLFGVRFDPYIFTFLAALLIFRIFDHFSTRQQPDTCMMHWRCCLFCGECWRR